VATKNVNIDIIAKDKTHKAMQSATRGVNNLKNNVASSVQSQQRSFMALGNTVKLVLGGVVLAQTIRFGKQMVDMASAVEEMQSKSSVVFGNFTRSVRNQLEEFGNAVGRSTFELEGMASSIQDTFVPMGFARGEASKLSVQLTKLAVDVASFNNASDTETMMAFQSALVGNHETVRRFGVVITEATLKQELLRMGITKSANEVTNAEKVQARLNLIIAGTSDAQGDAIRTADSFANSSKALSASLDELGVSVMKPLLPVLSGIVQGMTEATKSTQSFLQSIGLIPRNFEDTVKTATVLNKLLNERAEVEEHIGKLNEKFQSKEIERFNIILDKINERIKAERGLLRILEEQRMQQRQKSDFVMPEKQIVPTRRPFIADEDFLPVGVANFRPAPRGITTEDTGTELLDSKPREIVALEQMADMEVAIAKSTADKKLSILDSFNKGFMSSLDEQKNAFSQIEDIGEKSFGKLKTTLTDFVMTGKLNIGDLGKFVVRSFVEMLVGEAVKMAFAKSSAMFKADAIAKGTASVFQGALKTFAEIPFPLNLVAVGGAIAFGTSLLNKIKGFEKGGRPPVGQPSIVGEKGAELFVPDQAGTIVPNDKLGMGQPVTVNFNINTVDARGFNELLVNSRGVIVNMINQAVNEKGRMAIV
tara:strand:- start:578 stop:2527 length:1950 start_codon:yes stop_codon:yes gene_type:complete